MVNAIPSAAGYVTDGLLLQIAGSLHSVQATQSYIESHTPWPLGIRPRRSRFWRMGEPEGERPPLKQLKAQEPPQC